MEQQDVIRFFDRCAPSWDADLVRNEAVISAILDNTGICAGMDVLDVACGTGVLFPDYLGRGVASLTAIDLSPEMAKLAQQKFPQVNVLCGDAEQTDFAQCFDTVMIYNAFPHFPEPACVIERLAKWVKPGGRLSVAHGMSRDKLVQHHAGSASRVSIDLPEAHELAKLFAPWFDVDVMVSNHEMYQVCGKKRN
ncbi:MAG: class I SAM-dependent methyltransferase [Faecousia sp.]